MLNQFSEVLQSRKNGLLSKLSECEMQEKFLKRCKEFELSEEMIGAILVIINHFEPDEFVYAELGVVEPSSYQTIYRGRTSDPSGCSSYDDDRTPSSVFIEGRTIKVALILDSLSYNFFNSLTFSKCKDFEASLNKFLVGKKHFRITKRLNENDLAKEFPYLKDFLEQVSLWRYKNKVISIYGETLKDLAGSFIESCKKVT